MREKYESLPLATLKELAKARGIKGVSTAKKAEVIEKTVHTREQGTSTETSSGKGNDWTSCCICIVAVFIVFAILGAIFRF